MGSPYHLTDRQLEVSDIWVRAEPDEVDFDILPNYDLVGLRLEEDGKILFFEGRWEEGGDEDWLVFDVPSAICEDKEELRNRDLADSLKQRAFETFYGEDY